MRPRKTSARPGCLFHSCHLGIYNRLWNVSLWIATVLICTLPAVSQETQPDEDESLVAFDPSDPIIVEELLVDFREKSLKWQSDVDKLSANNATQGSPEHTLLLGSSSFRLWETFEQDLAPLKVVKRAYGGARYRDLAIYTPELIHGLKFSKAVVFIANDITGKDDDSDPQTVSKLARLVIAQLRHEQPNVQIYLLPVTPTPVRYKYWPRIQVTNSMLRKIAESTPGVYYIPTAYAFLDRDGHPRAELFKSDRLHLNDDGYHVWSKIILGALETVDHVSK
ncbi:MAG: GDSL-type esterase/lipase family protein [Planctomycetota bacterium]